MAFDERQILEKLKTAYPRPLAIRHFEVVKEDEQSLKNLLFELDQRELIEGKFIISRQPDTYGLPIDATSFLITKEGREFLDDKNEQQSVGHIFNVNADDGANIPLNVANGDININNNAEADELLHTLLAQLEKSNLPPQEKKGLLQALKSVSSASIPVVAKLLVEAVKRTIKPTP